MTRFGAIYLVHNMENHSNIRLCGGTFPNDSFSTTTTTSKYIYIRRNDTKFIRKVAFTYYKNDTKIF
jgi:hypothetical protein